MARLKIGNHVRVTWEDHWEITNQEMSLKEIQEKCSQPLIGKATGFVVINNRKVLVLASNHWPKQKGFDDAAYDGSIFIIIKKNITELKVLK